MNLRVNWIFIYGSSKKLSFNEAMKMKKKFCKFSKDKFYMLEEFISPRLLFTVLRNYIRLNIKGRRLLKQYLFKLPKSEINFYYIYKNDWKKSVVGKTLIENILWYRVFQRIFSALADPNMDRVSSFFHRTLF